MEPPTTGLAMKRCSQCRGKLGLGVRSRNVWNGRWWVHVLYCSTHCEALHELERYDARVKRGRHAFIPRSSRRTDGTRPLAIRLLEKTERRCAVSLHNILTYGKRWSAR